MAGTIRWVVSSAFLACAVAPADVHAGACARPEIPTRALTQPDAVLVKGGGVVVAMENAAKAPALTFIAGGKKLAATKKVIGAGLVVYTPPPGTGPIRLRGAEDLVAVKRGADGKALDAPKVAGVTYHASTGRRGTYVSIAVELTGGVPAGAVAVAVFDDKGAIRSWGDVSTMPPLEAGEKSRQVGVYASGSCVVQPNGFAPSNVGEKIAVAFIDASGRISPKTSATVVQAPPPSDSIAPRP